jgi:hypothetical protein
MQRLGSDVTERASRLGTARLQTAIAARISVLGFMAMLVACSSSPNPTARVESNKAALSLFPPSSTPANIGVGSGPDVELGVQFDADVSGVVDQIHFYKASTDTGQHTGHVWSATGTLLATVPFSSETSSGWQSAPVSPPVSITAGTTYVVSYHTNTGFSYDPGYYNSPVNEPPLHVPVGGGVYDYGPNPSFPSQNYQNSNYWVDFNFTAQQTNLFPSSATPSTFSTDTSPYELGVIFHADVTGIVTAVNFYKDPSNTGSHVVNLWSNSGSLLSSMNTAGLETASGWQSIPLPSAIQISANTDYVVSYSTSSGFSYDYAYFDTPYDNAPLHAPESAGVYATTPGTFPTGVYGNSNYWVDVGFSADGCTPQCSGATCGGSDGCGGICCTGSSTCTPATCGQCGTSNSCGSCTPVVDNTTCSTGVCELGSCVSTGPTNSVFQSQGSPSTFSTDTSSYELGMAFYSAQSGSVEALRFYKDSADNGSHVGSLRDNDGNLLAQVTFTNETTSGWQQQALSTSVPITAGTTYVVSYSTSTGFYYDAEYFDAQKDTPPLHVPVAGGVYGASGSFPTQVYADSNYWVDVVTVAGSCTPQCSGVSCGGSDGCGGTCCTGSSSCNEVSCGECTTANSCGSACIPVVDNTTCSTGVCQVGSCVSTGPTNSIFQSQGTPASFSTDTTSYELGMNFNSDNAATAQALRFYRNAVDTQAHTGSLWDGSGNLLGTTTFPPVSGSGWQQQPLSPTVPISANIDYVVSITTTSGFSYDTGYFNVEKDTPPLHAPVGSGVYGAGGTFPTVDYEGDNYWVDVVTQ